MIPHHAPKFTVDQVCDLVCDFYGHRPDSICALDSYDDQNFRIDLEGDVRVVKIARHGELAATLQAQHVVMNSLVGTIDGVEFPQVCPSRGGDDYVVVSGEDDRPHLLRMLTYIDGHFWADTNGHTPQLRRHLGVVLGKMTDALMTVEHCGFHRDLWWDLGKYGQLDRGVSFIVDLNQRRIVEHMRMELDQSLAPILHRLRRSAIHNDANDRNVLVNAATHRVCGLIDFGDLVFSHTVAELAVGCAYAMLHCEDPICAACDVVEGFNEHNPLEGVELEALLPMIWSRLLLSVVSSAQGRLEQPENQYITVSEGPIWSLIHKLLAVPPDRARRAFSQACGHSVGPARPRKLTLEMRSRHLGRSLSLHYKEPIQMFRGIGQYLYGEDGRRYLDLVNNVCHVGHAHPAITRAGSHQMATLNTNTRYLNDIRLNYAQQLCATLPDPLEVCFFVCSGSEANDLALRMARTHTQRNDCVVVDAAYHGNTTSVIELSPYKFDGKGGKGQAGHIHKVSLPDTYRGPHRGHDAADMYAKDAQRVLVELRNRGRAPAAFFCESVLGCGGQITLPEGYLKALYELIRAEGGLCVADEVQVGFGRVGAHFWGFQTQSVVPDIVTMGKPMGNGHPIAAVITTREIADSFANGMEYFNTFGGNPVSCAIGQAVLDVIESEGLQEHAKDCGVHLLQRLKALQPRHQSIGDVRGIGLFIGIELVKDAVGTPDGDLAASVVEEMKRRQILVGRDGPMHNVIKIKPPMVVSFGDLDHFVQTLDEILAELVG